MTVYKTLSTCLQTIAVASLLYGLPISDSMAQDAPKGSAIDLYEQGDYEAAGPLFEQAVIKYPSAPTRFEYQFKGGYCYLLSGSPEKAVKLLQDSVQSAAPDSIKSLSQSLLPQALVAQATATDDDNKKAALLKQAVNEFDIFFEKFASAPNQDMALYGRAVAHFHAGNYDTAVTDLKRLLKTYPDSSDVLETKLLLALTLFTQGNAKLMADIEANRDEAFEIYDEAITFLEELAAQDKNIAVANDAKFQLAEVMLSKAGASTKDNQPELFQKAINSYRTIQPKAQTLIDQQKLINKTVAAKKAALARQQGAQFEKLQQLEGRYRAKLAAIEADPDQTKEARLKVAQSYFQVGDYDAARVLFRYIKETDPDKAVQEPALYSIAMTYTLQNLVDPAEKSYQAFREKYKKAPMAENLSLAMGAMFLGQNEPETALEYFKRQTEDYPTGELAELTALQTANAYMLLARYDEALKTFQDYLKSNPDGKPEATVQAEMGIANIYKDTNQLDKALPAFETVRSKYTDIPDAVGTATFWIGWINLQNTKAAVAVTELNKFLANHVNHDLEPLAMFTLAQSLAGTGKEDDSLATYKSLAEKHPDTEPAVFSYFQLGQAYAARGDLDSLRVTMQAFIEKYPEDDKVFIAYETIANSHQSTGNIADTVATYMAFVEKYPEDSKVPTALLRSSNLSQRTATSLGRFTGLGEEERAIWNDGVQASITATELSLTNFPEDEDLALTLKSLLTAQKLLTTAKQKDNAQIETYFQDLADKFKDIPATRSKILFTLASFISEEDPDRAIVMMEKAYDPALIYAPEGLDNFGAALITGGKLEEAQAVYTKLADDYPNPEGVDPQQAPAQVQEAQSRAIYGLGKILQDQGNDTKAAEYYQKIKTLYPWSPKILEASYGIAARDFKAGKLDEAMKVVVQIIRASTKGTTELRAKAMLMGGYIQKKRYETTSDAKEKEEALKGAIDYFIKIAKHYEGIPSAATEGLWQGGQLLEAQVKTLTDPEKKSRQQRIAYKTYKKLATNYPDSEHASAAQQKADSLKPKK